MLEFTVLAKNDWLLVASVGNNETCPAAIPCDWKVLEFTASAGNSDTAPLVTVAVKKDWALATSDGVSVCVPPTSTLWAKNVCPFTVKAGSKVTAPAVTDDEKNV